MPKKTHAERQRDWQSFCDHQERSASKSTVEVFYHEQNAERVQPACVIPRAQAQDWRADGVGEFISHGKQFRLYSDSPEPALHFLPSESVDSSASISFEEMKANVGITDDEADQPAARGIVKRAQQKVRAIRDREGFDKAAPLAFGSQPPSSAA